MSWGNCGKVKSATAAPAQHRHHRHPPGPRHPGRRRLVGLPAPAHRPISRPALRTRRRSEPTCSTTIEATHRRELAEADKAKDWKERQRLREAAEKAHAARLSRVEELAASFAEIEGRGTATSVT